MSRFVSACQQLARQLNIKSKTGREPAQIEIGRAWAVQLVDAPRSGDETLALVVAGVMLSGSNQEPEAMAGLLDELSLASKDGIR